MRVQVSTLGVVMSDTDSAPKGNIDWYILHGLRVESGLELGAHESITITWVDQAEEMNTEHSHIKSDRDNNEAEDSGHQVLGKKTLSVLGRYI